MRHEPRLQRISSQNFNKIGTKYGNIFWDNYVAFKKYLIANESELVVVRSDLKWTEDSSIHYQTYLNDKFIDSGTAITLKTKLDKAAGRKCQFAGMQQSNETKDSIVVCRSEINKGDYLETIYRKKEGMLLKVVTNKFSGDILKYSDTVFYSYDNRNRISIEKTVSHTGQICNKKEYKYFNDTEFEYTEEKYLGKDNILESSMTYNKYGKIIESFKPSIWNNGSLFAEKAIYKYGENGLLTGITVLHNDKLYYKKNYQYSYFK